MADRVIHRVIHRLADCFNWFFASYPQDPVLTVFALDLPRFGPRWAQAAGAAVRLPSWLQRLLSLVSQAQA